jgi:DNA-binding MarR family transcriptional regulator
VSLNISGTLSDASTDPSGDAAAPARKRRSKTVRAAAARDALTQAVVDELTSWNPVQFLGLFKHMHKDAISLVHLSVLMELQANGSMPMGKLADAIGVSVASTTGIVDRMERRGFVVRRHDETDRRVVLVEATAAAADVFTAIDFHRREGLRALLAGLDDAQLRALLDGHRALRAARAAFGAKYGVRKLSAMARKMSADAEESR